MDEAWSRSPANAPCWSRCACSTTCRRCAGRASCGRSGSRCAVRRRGPGSGSCTTPCRTTTREADDMPRPIQARLLPPMTLPVVLARVQEALDGASSGRCVVRRLEGAFAAAAGEVRRRVSGAARWPRRGRGCCGRAGGGSGWSIRRRCRAGGRGGGGGSGLARVRPGHSGWRSCPRFVHGAGPPKEPEALWAKGGQLHYGPSGLRSSRVVPKIGMHANAKPNLNRSRGPLDGHPALWTHSRS